MLRPGSSGEAVRDLQLRLGALGYEIPPIEAGAFGDATEHGGRARSRTRAGCGSTASAGRETWAALVESGFRLGDRLLYRRRPMLRGDDVAELQRRLNAPRLRRRAGGRHLRRRHRRARSIEFQRNVGPRRPTASAAPRDHRGARPRRQGWPRARWRACASARRCAAARTGSRASACSSPPRPGSRPSPTPSCTGWPSRRRRRPRHHRRRRLRCSRPRPTATPPTSSSAVRPRRRARVPVQLLRVGPLPLRGRLPRSPTAVSAELAPMLGGDAGRRAGAPTRVLRETRMAAVHLRTGGRATTSPAMRGARHARAPTSPDAIVRGVRRGVERPPPSRRRLSVSLRAQLSRAVRLPGVAGGAVGHQPVDPLEVLEGRELDHHLAPRCCPSRSSPGSRGGRRAAPRARQARAGGAARRFGAGVAVGPVPSRASASSPWCSRTASSTARTERSSSTTRLASCSWNARSGVPSSARAWPIESLPSCTDSLDRRRELQEPQRVGDRRAARARPGPRPRRG